MYYAFFGLKQPPFRITPDTDFFFEGGDRGAVLEALIYAITHGEGIVKIEVHAPWKGTNRGCVDVPGPRRTCGSLARGSVSDCENH